MIVISGQATAFSINAGNSRKNRTFHYRLLKSDMTTLTAFTATGVSEALENDGVTKTGSYGVTITITDVLTRFIQWRDTTDERCWISEITLISQYPADIEKVSGTTAPADKLELSADSMVTGTVDTATFTPTTSVFEADDITEATADHYNGRVIIWTTGDLKDQAAIIDDYELANGKGKFTTKGLMTEAPANNDTFIIV